MKPALKTGLLVSLFLLCFAIENEALRAQPLAPPLAPEPPLTLDDAMKKAKVNGKYSMLLAQVNAPQDEAQYGKFKDAGFSEPKEVGGLKNLPAGYWVYVAPYWYIWRDSAQNSRRWGPEQATGEPNTLQIGDNATAWAPQTPDGQDEWLLLEYANPVTAASVKIYETHNPGAISKITAFALDGKEEVIWQGQENPAPAGGAVFVNQKNFPRPFKTCRIKVYLDSKRVAGLNEIDAVELINTAGKTQWAINAASSSTYADIADPKTLNNPQNPAVIGNLIGNALQPDVVQPGDERIRILDQALRQMHEDLNELHKRAGLPPLPAVPPLPANPAPNVDLLFGGLGGRFFNWNGVPGGGGVLRDGVTIRTPVQAAELDLRATADVILVKPVAPQVAPAPAAPQPPVAR